MTLKLSWAWMSWETTLSITHKNTFRNFTSGQGPEQTNTSGLCLTTRVPGPQPTSLALPTQHSWYCQAVWVLSSDRSERPGVSVPVRGTVNRSFWGRTGLDVLEKEECGSNVHGGVIRDRNRQKGCRATRRSFYYIGSPESTFESETQTFSKPSAKGKWVRCVFYLELKKKALWFLPFVYLHIELHKY